jgi:hypothetical protein
MTNGIRRDDDIKVETSRSSWWGYGWPVDAILGVFKGGGYGGYDIGE